MNDVDPNQNCHQYCQYAKYCRYSDGGNGWEPENCAMYCKIEDLLWDATMDAQAEREEREREFEECDDW